MSGCPDGNAVSRKLEWQDKTLLTCTIFFFFGGGGQEVGIANRFVMYSEGCHLSLLSLGMDPGGYSPLFEPQAKKNTNH